MSHYNGRQIVYVITSI